MATLSPTRILQRLDSLERELAALRQQLDPDSKLEAADRRAIREADADARAGLLVPLDEWDRQRTMLAVDLRTTKVDGCALADARTR